MNNNATIQTTGIPRMIPVAITEHQVTVTFPERWLIGLGDNRPRFKMDLAKKISIHLHNIGLTNPSLTLSFRDQGYTTYSITFSGVTTGKQTQEVRTKNVSAQYPIRPDIEAFFNDLKALYLNAFDQTIGEQPCYDQLKETTDAI